MKNVTRICCLSLLISCATAITTFGLTVDSGTSCPAIQFAAPANYGVGFTPHSVAVGDFNGDGKQDFATANLGGLNGGTVSIRLGDGLGSFGPTANFSVGAFGPEAMAVGDFNGDGKQDIATVNDASDNISILLGDGTGNFGAASIFGAGISPGSIKVGDFNGDGRHDLAIANHSSNNVSILLGNGLGSFAPRVSFPVGFGPSSVAVGDFNGDGKQDIAATNSSSQSNSVSILLGTGTGNFGAAANFGVGSGSSDVAVGDFNGDGKQDIGVVNAFSNNVSILLGNGAGSFAAATNFGTGTQPVSMVIGDFNGDGKQDIATANQLADSLSVLVGNGLGGFAAANSFPLASAPYAIALGDFNGDGLQDLAATRDEVTANAVSILLRTCTASTPTNTPTSTPTATNTPTAPPTATPTATSTPCVGAGCLDPTFDHDGRVTTDLGGEALGYDVAVQSDGKIVVSGQAGTFPNVDMALVRYNPDGSLDTCFDADGKVTTDFLGFSDYAFAVVIQPDGKIVAAGLALGDINGSTANFALARYNNDGSLDTSFDGDGKVTTSVGNGRAFDLIVQSDGKIVAVGSGGTNKVSLARYNANGSLDTSFDGDGIVISTVAGSANSVKLQSDNKIVIGGTGGTGMNGDDFLLARFETNGQLDSTFGSGGALITDMSGGDDDSAYDIAIQSDGKIVLVGWAVYLTGDFAMLRSNTNGTLDTGFGSGGRVITDFGFSSAAYGVAIQNDGKIVSAGRSREFEDSNFALSRHNADGTLDSSFGSNGLVTTDFALRQDQAEALALQPDGKIVAAGFTRTSPGVTSFGVARYLATAASNASFDYDGDGKTDISVFRQSEGAWYLQQSQAGVFGAQFGVETDKITPADFDGDDKTDIAVYRPTTGIWYVLNSSNGTVSYYQFGLAEDLPTPADYDGDGKADVSVFRPSIGTWYRQNSGTGTFFGIQFGASEDKPIVGDFDGDGKSDIAVFRPSTGAWYQVYSSNGSIHGENFGFGTDILTPADYDGDGKMDVGVFRPSDGYWYARNSSDGAFTYKIFGLATDIPAPGDFDGDGKADVCVFRPADGTWYRQNSSNGAFIAFQFGTNGDKPTMTAFRY